MIGAGLWLVSGAQAATWTVAADGSGQFSSIQAAVSAAASGDTIQVGPGRYAEAVVVGDKALSLVSTAGASATTIDASGLSGDALQAWGDLTLSGFTLANTGGRGLGIWAGRAQLSDITWDEVGGSSVYGAAIYAGSGVVVEGAGLTIQGGMAYVGMIYASQATLTLADLTISGSEAAASGAGLAAYASAVTIEGGSLERLYAAGTGGAMLVSGGSLVLREVEVYGNLTDYGHGPGLYAESAEITVEGGRFELNASIHASSGYDGGALYLNGGSALLDSVELTENYANYGGAIRLVSGALVMQEVTAARNGASYGGVVYASGTSSVSLLGGEWIENIGDNGGGGLYMQDAFSLSVEGTAFRENSATYGHGGVIYAYYAGNSTFTGATFEDNTAYYQGGAVFSYYTYGRDVYSGCTFEGNESTYGVGGAISANAYVDVTVTGSRFAYNESSGGDAGAIYAYYSPLAVSDSEFIGNASSRTGGAIYSYYAWVYSQGGVRIERSTFQSNAAVSQGGAIASSYDDIRITDSTFLTNDVAVAGMGGAVFLDHALGIEGLRNRFIGNNAGYGGAIYDSTPDLGAGGERWASNVFQENTAVIGGAGAWVGVAGAELRNNTFVANTAVEAAGSIALVEAGLAVVGNAFVGTGADTAAALHAYDEASLAGSRFAHNAYHALSAGIASGHLGEAAALGVGSLQVEPRFAAWSPDGDPDNDSYVLLRDSALIDAGDPEVLDPDGSPSDIGAWGGPEVLVVDVDKDGHPGWIDCEDAAADAHPGGTERFYDGTNQDCLSGSDYDADADGHDAEDYGGDDCDDADPARFEGCSPPDDSGEPDDDDTDRPDGPRADAPASVGCSSHAAPVRGGWGWLALLGVVSGAVLRRR